MRYYYHMLLFAFLLISISFTVLMAQAPGDQANVAQEGAGSEKKLEGMLQNLESKYIPKQDGIHNNFDPDKEKKHYDTIIQILDNIEKILLPRLMDQVDVQVDIVDDHLRDRSLFSKNDNSILELQSVNYHSTISRKIKHSKVLYQIMTSLKQVDEKLLDIQDVLSFSGVSEAQLNNTIYRTKNLKALLLIIRADQNDFVKAVDEYQYLLGKNSQNKNYINDQEKKAKAYNVLASCYRMIYNRNRNTNPSFGLGAIRHELFNLWQLALIKTAGRDEKLKDYHLKKLVAKYLPIIDYKGSRYNQYYKNYIPATEKDPAQQKVDAADNTAPTPNPQQ